MKKQFKFPTRKEAKRKYTKKTPYFSPDADLSLIMGLCADFYRIGYSALFNQIKAHELKAKFEKKHMAKKAKWKLQKKSK